MAASAEGCPIELKDVDKRILEQMKKGGKKDEIRDLKLLLAQIRVDERDFNGALNIYHELSNEDPQDFKIYLCQAIAYRLLGKNDEAENNRYKRLVPEGYIHAKYIDDNW
ncbi:hypothetical protein L1987_61106 [Smallanthus sonchifolius]|uniref:Uncharacterized protein n=1 Tax=Smallanthus sonchifolius TaxID=185202 RepID=A0ACB9DAS9_9ASTR|nr:hypothetical protein L1987_61106 [Smallanthus sonchifolius]